LKVSIGSLAASTDYVDRTRSNLLGKIMLVTNLDEVRPINL